MKCVNGHEFEAPIYVPWYKYKVDSAGLISASTSPELELDYFKPACPFCRGDIDQGEIQ